MSSPGYVQSQADGTTQYQYVSPQQTGVMPVTYSPGQQQVAVDSQTGQQYYAQSPAIQQQPIQQQPIQQQYYQPQPQVQQAAYVVTTQEQTTTEMPVVSGNGKGIVGKMPQVENCCLAVPLHTGALIIAFLMFIYYGYCGLALLVSGSFSGGIYIAFIIIGIVFLLIAVISGYGFMGIYKEEPLWVDRFIKFYLIGSVVWLLLEIVYMAIYASYGFFPWAGWIVQIIIAGAFQYYFCVCLVSYQRVLHARVNGGEKIVMA
ncbi:hypothetical protein BGZ76_007514 [Entomortierella beljakovae]|nr:hypothetical protein BGZ76_007514 [Entomortierella beljakovae]